VMMRAVRVVWLTAIWLALWADVSAANALSGVAASLAVVALFRSGRTGRVVVRPLAALRFAVHFLRSLVASSVVVARTVVTPRDRIRTGIVAVPLRGCSDGVATVIADAITLTPGTLTLEVRREPLTLYVHALDVRDVEQVRGEVRTLEILAVRAFGSEAAIADLEVDDTSAWRGR
jgi:multicomponent Na+:H+ antiporter subunit E